MYESCEIILQGKLLEIKINERLGLIATSRTCFYSRVIFGAATIATLSGQKQCKRSFSQGSIACSGVLLSSKSSILGYWIIRNTEAKKMLYLPKIHFY